MNSCSEGDFFFSYHLRYFLALEGHSESGKHVHPTWLILAALALAIISVALIYPTVMFLWKSSEGVLSEPATA